jgi:hypothetical protein
VLGPQQDRALFDKVLPKEVAVSCINREVGRTPVDKGFAEVRGRGKWAIPWLEDDPALTSPQLWVGRMRRDAADARRYGCDGLMGIHWRTRVLGPAVSALAGAAWSQEAWSQPPAAPPPAPLAGPEGGSVADYPNNPIGGTEDDRLYQNVRYNLTAYRFPVPDGVYAVTLKFCEPHYAEAGKRVFDVKLQGSNVIHQLDIFSRVGKDRPLDFRFESVKPSNGWLNVEFVPRVEFPSIAALAIEGAGFTQKVNCGGPAYGDFAADWPAGGATAPAFPPTRDFYGDWARHEFGPEVGESAASIFARIDGRLPRPSDWVEGPGGIRPDPRPWAQVAPEYAFVEELERLEPRVRGAGDRERFAYWLNTFRYLRAMGQVNCTWAEYNRAFERVKAEPDAGAQEAMAAQSALPLRRELVSQVATVYRHLLALVSNPGELGTIANWEQHLLPGLLTKPGEDLARVLGQPLPPDAQPSPAYRGAVRVLVPTTPGLASPGRPIPVKVIVLAAPGQTLQEAALAWRPLGKGRFTAIPLEPVSRGVYRVTIPPQPTFAEALEYYVKVTPASGDPVYCPATAPRLNQSMVIW